MTESPDYQEHRRYTVTFRCLNGNTSTRRVLTNRGEAKAVFLATRGASKPFTRLDALDVVVVDDGPVELDQTGTAIVRGYGIDRSEW